MKKETTDPPTHATVPSRRSGNYLIPGAIVLAGLLIGAGIYFSGGVQVQTFTPVTPSSKALSAPPAQTNIAAVRAITEEDHIKGNPNAPVVIVEYSDYECPFCKRFHVTMNNIMQKYGKTGEVAWVYRHFPLDQLHPRNARIVAAASECVNELAGNDGFWQFTDGYMAVTPSNDRTDLKTVLPQLYREIGVDQGAVEECIASGRYDQHVQDDVDNAFLTGGRGTPWSILVTKSGKTYPINGAQSQQTVEQLIGIAQKEG